MSKEEKKQSPPSQDLMKNNDLLDIYFNQAGQHELLDRKEEIRLVKVMQKWSKNKSNCGQKARLAGQEARDKLITSNLRLVIKMANDYKFMGLDLADLINEGNVGLMQAVDKYELDRGSKLSYYAAFWIKQRITRALANAGRTVRLPVGVVQQKIKILKFVDEFKQKKSRKPTMEEIVAKFKLTEGRVALLMEVWMQSTSIHEPVGKDKEEGAELGDFLEDSKILPPDLQVERNNMNAILEKCMSQLSSRERTIIEKRFGLALNDRQTLENIGESFKLTRERIRQVEWKAIKKLRFLMEREMKISS